MHHSDSADTRPRSRDGLWAYVELARVDHWFKNSFMVLGVVLAMFYQPAILHWRLAPRLLLALLATCLVASANYVLNELLDAPTDALHPQKRHRPAVSGRINRSVAYAQWIALTVAGLSLAARIAPSFAASAAALWAMGIVYNVPPIRTKDFPYLDVLTEAVNNPIRLLLGWFALVDRTVPPVSLLIAYWMAGAFFMATKRYAEFRHIADPKIAAAYRRSFAYYTEDRLLVSVVFYATACALFSGIFIVRYHLELILLTPLAAGLFAQYLKLGLMPDSPAQHPERLYQHRGFAVYLIVCVIVFVGLMFTEIPVLYDWFNVERSANPPLWKIQ
jgi:decaprenyl-phosphate phosphoribosyltransferase